MKAAVVTHVGGFWGRPETLDANVNERLKQDCPKLTVWLYTDRNDMRKRYRCYNQKSPYGYMEEKTIEKLSKYDDITVMGLYKDMCHIRSFEGAVKSIGMSNKAGSVTVPLDCTISWAGELCEEELKDWSLDDYMFDYDRVAETVFPDFRRYQIDSDVVYHLKRD